MVGIDLAWGERNPDSLCLVRLRGRKIGVVDYIGLVHGDDALMGAIDARIPAGAAVFLAVDAPLVCPNQTRSRPVDRETHRLFHREHAGCHPANATKCPRPLRIADLLRDRGAQIGVGLPGFGGAPAMVAAEVYPHPAMVRLFGLSRIVKYKRGRVAVRRLEFQRLQKLLAEFWRSNLPRISLGEHGHRILSLPWTKPVEDQVDALFCAVIGIWHVAHRGTRTEMIGDLDTGFILLPKPCDPSA